LTKNLRTKKAELLCTACNFAVPPHGSSTLSVQLIEIHQNCLFIALILSVIQYPIASCVCVCV